MWIPALIAIAAADPTAPVIDTASGSSTALIITAACGGIAAIVTALSLLIKARGDRTAPVAPGPEVVHAGSEPLSTQVAVVRRELEILRGDMIERVAAVRTDLDEIREEVWRSDARR